MGLGPSTLSARTFERRRRGNRGRSPTAREALARQWKLKLTLDFLGAIDTIRAPTHVIWSEADRFLPEAHALQLSEGIALALITSMRAGVGHRLMIENPDVLVSTALRFPDQAQTRAG